MNLRTHELTAPPKGWAKTLRFGEEAGRILPTDITGLFSEGGVLFNDIYEPGMPQDLVDIANDLTININGSQYTAGRNRGKIPMGLFKWLRCSDVSIAQYEHSEYSYLNKKMLANNVQEQPVEIEMRGVMAPENLLLYGWEAFTVALVSNPLLKQYEQAGGTYTVITPWNIFDTCVLTSFGGVSEESDNGLVYSFTFKVLLLDNSGADKKMAPHIGKMESGVAT